MKLTWLGHSSVRIDVAGQVVYIDPYAGDYAPASLVLVSRFDFDHCSMEKLNKARSDRTLVLGPNAVAREAYPARRLQVGERVLHEGIEVIGMPILKNQDALGFLIIAEEKRIYYMGDSAFEEEMRKANPDVLIISLKSAKESARIASIVGAKMTIPIHWGHHAGTRDEAELFKELCKSPVTILEPGKSVTV